MNTKRLLTTVCTYISTCLLNASTITLPASRDATITDEAPTTSQGLDSILQVSTSGKGFNYRVVMGFDLTSIPTNAIVTSAACSIRVVEFAPNPSWFDLRALKVPWTETSVTWVQRSTSPTLNWSIAGAQAPTDYSSLVSQSNYMSGGGLYTFTSTPQLVADVQRWIQTPTSNHGWIVISESQGTGQTVRKFTSRQSSTTNCPQLIVQYQLPLVLQTSMISNQLCLTWIAESNTTYVVDSSSELPVSLWVPMYTNTASLPGEMSYCVPMSDQGYYRVRIP